MTSTSKKTVLTIKEKYLAVKDLDKGLTKKNVAKKFSVPQNNSTYGLSTRKTKSAGTSLINLEQID